MFNNIILSLLSVLLLSMAWLGAPGYTLLVAFVPLLLIQQKNAGKILPYIILTFLLWNISTIFWIKNATWLGVIIAFTVNTFISTVSFMIYNFFWRRAKKVLAYTILVTIWITYEYIYINGQISFPWLILGNGFANSIKVVQWYEYTGVLGGSLWILISNIIVFESINIFKKSRRVVSFIPSLLFIIIPIITSLTIYYNYKEVLNPIKIEVIQPNINPYNEKFSTFSQTKQTDIILNLAANAPKNIDYIVTPETSFEDDIWEDNLKNNPTIKRLKNFIIKKYPDSEFIAGASTFKRYNTKNEVTETASTFNTINYWFDIYNSALQIDSTKKITTHHKSKLVAGVETIPYSKQLKFLDNFSLDLGGIMGELGVDKERVVFTSINGVKIGVVICYESVYGEYFTEYIGGGAEAMFVITNDGWWGDTPGYKQHFSYSRLRAVENRRGVARSANTGISGFINQRGDIISQTQWNERCSLYGELNLNNKLTIYSLYGDYIGRLSMYVLVLCILYYISYVYRLKDHIN